MLKLFMSRGSWILLIAAGGCAGPGPRPPENTAAGTRLETNSVVQLAAAARESIVVVTQDGRDGREAGVGAGFVISADGLIATSLHVIGERRRVRVRFADGRRAEVTEIHATDRKFDLAILRVEATGLNALKLGDSDSLKQGAPVVAIGNITRPWRGSGSAGRKVTANDSRGRFRQGSRQRRASGQPVKAGRLHLRVCSCRVHPWPIELLPCRLSELSE